jgi:hypothetical protein
MILYFNLVSWSNNRYRQFVTNIIIFECKLNLESVLRLVHCLERSKHMGNMLWTYDQI